MDLKLTDFPYSAPGYGRKVAVVCIGSAGCKIGSQLSKESRLLEHFVYISAAMNDIGGQGIGLWDEKDGFYYDVLHMGKVWRRTDIEAWIRKRKAPDG